MDRQPNPSEPEVGNDNTSNISCDSCLRNNTKCIGGPICERCSLHNFQCTYSPSPQTISDLKTAFQSLLSPPTSSTSASHEIEKTPSGGLTDPTSIFSKEALYWMDSNQDLKRDEKSSCSTCKYRDVDCGGQKPQCDECTAEGFACVYSAEQQKQESCLNCKYDHFQCPGRRTSRNGKPGACSRCRARGMRCDFQPGSATPMSGNVDGYGSRICINCATDGGKYCDGSVRCWWCKAAKRNCVYPGQEDVVTAERLKSIEIAREAQRCDICKVWEAYCDAEKPNCSSCQVRGVQCTYSSSTTSSKPAPRSSTNPYRSKAPPLPPSSRWQNPPIVPQNPPLPYSPPQYTPQIRYGSSPSLSQMYSTPSGCISCFNSKSKCVPTVSPASSSSLSSSNNNSSSKKKCQRCLTSGIECKPFSPGTKLIACDACQKSFRACTNLKEGLRCDGCVESGVSCSRVGKDDEELFVDPPIISSSTSSGEKLGMEQHHGEVGVERGEGGGDGGKCTTCVELHQQCDMRRPSCNICTEVGLSCQYMYRFDTSPSSSSTSSSSSSQEVAPRTQSRTKTPSGEDQALEAHQKGSPEAIVLDYKDDTKTISHAPQEKSMKSSSAEKIKSTDEKKKEKTTTESKDQDDWEEITHSDALQSKPGEFGVVELD